MELTTLDRVAEIETTTVNLQISTFTPLRNVYTRNNIPIHECNVADSRDVERWSHLQGICLPSASKDVEILIGQDNSDLLLPREVRTGDPGDPHATRSV